MLIVWHNFSGMKVKVAFESRLAWACLCLTGQLLPVHILLVMYDDRKRPRMCTVLCCTCVNTRPQHSNHVTTIITTWDNCSRLHWPPQAIISSNPLYMFLYLQMLSEQVNIVHILVAISRIRWEKCPGSRWKWKCDLPGWCAVHTLVTGRTLLSLLQTPCSTTSENSLSEIGNSQ